MNRQQQIAAAPILQSAPEKVALLSGIAETEDDLSPARGFFNGLATAVGVWALVALFVLVWRIT